MNIKKIQQYLNENKIDVWLIYSFRDSNPIFQQFFSKNFVTRKVFVFIYPNSKNKILCHELDKLCFNSYDFEIEIYHSFESLKMKLQALLHGCENVMMEISEDGMYSGCNYVDYGSAKMIENLGKNLISSANLLQQINSTLSHEAFALHKKASRLIDKIKNNAFELAFRHIKSGQEITEYQLQQYILKEFDKNNLVTDDPPIVAIARNAKNPHYQPDKSKYDYIKEGDLILIDLWAKLNNKNGVFADITWVGYAGDKVDKKYQQIFKIIKQAIDKTLTYLKDNLKTGQIRGCDVDKICRDFIQEKGYGKYFIHRTGHSLSVGDCDHGKGVNIDSFETIDKRFILEGSAFSIEPGIFLDDFGIREEINVVIKNGKPLVTTQRQSEILTYKDFNL